MKVRVRPVILLALPLLVVIVVPLNFFSRASPLASSRAVSLGSEVPRQSASSGPPATRQADARPQASGGALPVLTQISPASTVPSNGDLNPYGIAFVPTGFPSGGTVVSGDILVSNFNNSSNLQGTGTTIVSQSPGGQISLFFQGNPGLGLTTALGVLKSGFVLVGSVPTKDGSCATLSQGSLLVINDAGNLVTTLTDRTLDSPWGIAIHEKGHRAMIFVSNLVSGTVTRLDVMEKRGASTIEVAKKTEIGSGYQFACNTANLAVGPTGLAYDPAKDILYVASTGDNAIYAIAGAGSATQSAGTGTVIYSDNAHLHGPLALVLAPNGDLIVSNGDSVNPDPAQPSELVEFTTTGTFVSEFQVDPAPDGAFGVAVQALGQGFVQLATVDDNTNSVMSWIVLSQ